MEDGQAALEFRDGPRRGEVVELSPPTSIGRSKSCALVLDDPDASRVHCVLEYDANEYVLRDNASANGTYLNGRRINVAALRQGDVVRIGNAVLLFQLGVARKAPAETGTVLASAQLSLGSPPFDDVGAASPVEAIAAALAKYKVLYRTSELLARHADAPGLLKLVLEQAFEALAAERGAILLGTSPEQLELAASVSRTAHDRALPLSTTLLARVVARRETLLIRDTLTDARLFAAESVLGASSRAIICAPLACGDDVFGAIQLESDRERAAFEDDDLQMLAAVGRQIAIALSQREIEQNRREAVQRSRLRRFLAPEMAERLVDAPETWKNGRRSWVFLLCVELRSLSSTLDDHASLEGFNRLCDRLSEIVFAHGGTIGKLTGDALVAFWGAPFQDDEGARHSADAALAIQAHAARGSELPRETMAQLRVALHHGEALVGELGARARPVYTAVGAEVDACARIVGAAAPGTVVASAPFHHELSTQLVGHWVEPAGIHGDGSTTRLFAVTSCRTI